MKPDVKPSIYIDVDVENNNKNPKFKFGGHARISKYKDILAKDYFSNWSEKVFVIQKIKKYCTIDTCNKGPLWRINCWNI